jgi:hypothetical protein
VIVSKPVTVANGPDAGKSAWLVTANYIGNGNGQGYTLTAYVLCAPTKLGLHSTEGRAGLHPALPRRSSTSPAVISR